MARSGRYRLSPRAETDLEEIWLYTFRNWSLEQADAYVSRFVAAFEDLGSEARKGRSVDAREGYFKYAVGSHLIYYRRSRAGIDVIRVLHQRMDPDRHL
ncbi:MAG: type II toxin-antitoxin system RelE/ParE family toxin [Parvibaculaceae bacterium]